MIKFAEGGEPPEDLPPGEYNTRIVKAYFREGDLVIEIAYVGPKTAPHQCLITMIKEADGRVSPA